MGPDSHSALSSQPFPLLCPSLHRQTPRTSFLLLKLSSLIPPPIGSYFHHYLKALSPELALMSLWLITVDFLVLVLHILLVFDGCPLPFYCFTLGFINSNSHFFLLPLLVLLASLLQFSLWLALESSCSSRFCPQLSFSLHVFFLGCLIISRASVASCHMLMTHISAHPWPLFWASDPLSQLSVWHFYLKWSSLSFSLKFSFSVWICLGWRSLPNGRLLYAARFKGYKYRKETSWKEKESQETEFYLFI